MDGKKQFLNVWMLAALTFVSVSCVDDEFENGGKLRGGVIGFGTSAFTAGDGTPLSRAVRYGDTPLILLDKSGNDTLYLHTSIERNLSAVAEEKQATRGVPVNSGNFKEVCKSFGVTALTPDGQIFMSDEEIGDYSGGVWLPDETRYWPSEEMDIDFYAYAPYSYDGKKTIGEGGVTDMNITDGSLEFSYKVPFSTDRTADATVQPDIMFCHKACSKNSVDPATGAVPLNFEHALAGVRFVAGDIAGCTVKTVAIENVYGEGSCVYEYGESDGAFTWKTSRDAVSYSQTFDVAVSNSQTGEQQITDKNPVTTFMLIPQMLPENAGIKVVLQMPDGTEQTLTGSLKGQNWEAGSIYTYKISTESINWEYVFEVRASGTSNPAAITMPLGGTTGTYEVVSYRRRVQTGEIQPVKWNATENSAKETDMESGAVSDISFGDVVTDFTSSGNGGEDSSYSIVIDRARMRTSYNGDEALQNAALVGSPDNPYDLSLDDGYGGNRNTANCYIVPAAGTYKLPLVYGNAIKDGGTNSSAYDGSDFTDYMGNRISSPYIYDHYTPHDCILVWSDGFYMFKDVRLSADKHFLEFTLDHEYMQQANAIVAVRDNQGKIMWSWHIWVTEHTFTDNDLHWLEDWNNSSVRYGLMPYNLGWVDGKMVYYNQRDLSYTFTQDVSGKTAVLNVTQKGDRFDYRDVGSTYYQWGRKDPIVALRNFDAVGRDDYRPQETIDPKYQYDVVQGRSASMEEAIQNPNVYYAYFNGSAQNWLNQNRLGLWGCNDANAYTSIKTVYDPSPKGFKVPFPNAFSVMVKGSTGNSGGVDKFNGYKDSSPNYPNHNQYWFYQTRSGTGSVFPCTATGQRADRPGLEVYSAGDMASVSEPGGLWAMYGVYYWTSVALKDQAYAAYTFVARSDYPSGNNTYTSRFSGTRSMARPVRCIKE